MYSDSKRKFIINTVYYSIIILIAYIVFKFLFAYLLPFIIGTIITILVQKPSEAVSKRTKIKKGYCALALVILIYVALFLAVSFFIFKVGVYIYNFTLNDSKILSSVSTMIDNIVVSLENIFKDIPDFATTQISNIFKNFINVIVNAFTSFTKSIVAATPMFLTSSLVTIIASCYIAKDYDRFKISVKSVLSDRVRLIIFKVRKLFKESITKAIKGYFIILIITIFELNFGLFLLRVDNFLLYGLLIGLLDLLPILGTGTFLIPWGVYSLITGKYYFGAGIIILYVVITIIRNIIEPKIIGKQIGLHPLIALISVFIGLKIFGIIGIFIMPISIMILYKMYDDGIIESIFNKQ